MPLCQQQNCCALSALDGNGGGKPRALPWAVMLRPFRPALCGVILDEESHGFSVDGTAQGLRYSRLGSLRYKGMRGFGRLHYEISGVAPWKTRFGRVPSRVREGSCRAPRSHPNGHYGWMGAFFDIHKDRFQTKIMPDGPCKSNAQTGPGPAMHGGLGPPMD